MCLAIPAQIVSLDESRNAEVSILGVTRAVALDLVPAAAVGDFVLVHAGYAIDVIDERMAQETLDLYAEFPELMGENDILGEPEPEPEPCLAPGPVQELVPNPVPNPPAHS